MTAKLKLSSVPDDKPVKLTVELPPDVHRDLLDYAAVMARETGKAAPDDRPEEGAHGRPCRGLVKAHHDLEPRPRLLRQICGVAAKPQGPGAISGRDGAAPPAAFTSRSWLIRTSRRFLPEAPPRRAQTGPAGGGMP